MFCFQPNYFYRREFLFLKVWLVLMKLSMKPTNCGLPGLILKLDYVKAYVRVIWDLMKEILTKREFSTRWIQWINSIISTGKSCIRIVGVAYEPNLSTAK
jgi:hypothetical protein